MDLGLIVVVGAVAGLMYRSHVTGSIPSESLKRNPVAPEPVFIVAGIVVTWLAVALLKSMLGGE